MLAVSVWLVFALMFAPIAMATTGFPHRFEPSDSVPAVGLAIVSLLLVFGCAYNLSYKLKVLPEGLIAKAITGTRKIQFADVRGIRIYTFQRKDGATEFMELRGDHAFLRLTGRLEGYPVLKSLILEACKGIPIENER